MCVCACVCRTQCGDAHIHVMNIHACIHDAYACMRTCRRGFGCVCRTRCGGKARSSCPLLTKPGVWSCVYMRACIHACVRACERACVRSCILHTCMNPCVHAFMLPCMHACSLSLSHTHTLTHTHTAHAPIPHYGVQHDAHAHRYPVRLGWRPRASDPDQDEAPVWPREGRYSYYANVNVSFAICRAKRLCGHARAGNLES